MKFIAIDKKDLKPQDFADDEWHKEDDKLFADPTDILDANESNLELNSILHKGFETNLQSEELYASSLFSDIPGSVGDEEEEKNNDIPDDQLWRETRGRLHL